MFFSKINFGWFDGSDGDPKLVGSDTEERIQKFTMISQKYQQNQFYFQN